MSDERRVIFRIDADTTQMDSKTESTLTRARSAELQFYRLTHLIEEMNIIAKHFFGVELPKEVTQGINQLQNVIATLRTMQILAAQAWAATLGPLALLGVGMVGGYAVASAIGGAAMPYTRGTSFGARSGGPYERSYINQRKF